MPKDMGFIEPDITINNTKLTLAQCMVIRVALENFAMQLSEGLGTDKLGIQIAKNYQDRLDEIRILLYESINEQKGA